MGQIQRRAENDLFWQKLVLPWEEKCHLDPFLVWDGYYRWFRSKNVIALEKYRDGAAMARIRANILSKGRRP
jgi:hypothetical protein